MNLAFIFNFTYPTLQFVSCTHNILQKWFLGKGQSARCWCYARNCEWCSEATWKGNHQLAGFDPLGGRFHEDAHRGGGGRTRQRDAKGIFGSTLCRFYWSHIHLTCNFPYHLLCQVSLPDSWNKSLHKQGPKVKLPPITEPNQMAVEWVKVLVPITTLLLEISFPKIRLPQLTQILLLLFLELSNKLRLLVVAKPITKSKSYIHNNIMQCIC